MKAFQLFHEGRDVQNEDMQEEARRLGILKPQERKRPQFSQETKTIPKSAAQRQVQYQGNVGFSEIAYIDDGLPKIRSPKLETMVRVKSGVPPDEEDSDDRELKETRNKYKLKDKYVQWMKNLSMFHQLREKVEEGRAKDKLEDYKLQIIKGLMQKNQILEDLEKKVTQMEQGEDPQQSELLKKIEQLEFAIAKKQKNKAATNQDDGKMNQAIDFMMYNMSVLQQMVNNVAQMQKTQMEHVQHTNKVIQSLPQIIAHLNYQTRMEDAQPQPRRYRRTQTPESNGKKKDKKVTIVSSSQIGKRSLEQSANSGGNKMSDVEATIKPQQQSSKFSQQQSDKQVSSKQKASGQGGVRLPPIEPDKNLIARSPQAVDSNMFRASALKSREKLGGGSGNLSPSGQQAKSPNDAGASSASKRPQGGQGGADRKPADNLEEGVQPKPKRRKRLPVDNEDPENKSQKFGSMSSEFNYTEDEMDGPEGNIAGMDAVLKDESKVQSEGAMRGVGRDRTGNSTINNGRNGSRRYSRYSDTQLAKDQSSILKPGREDDVSRMIAERMKKKKDPAYVPGIGDNSKGSKSDKAPPGLVLTPILENSEDAKPKPQPI